MTTPQSGIAGATRHRLANGMVALIQRNPAAPTVSVRGELPVGAVHEAAAQGGLAVFTAAALVRGAGPRSYQQIVAETEERGCSVHAGGGLHSSAFAAKALAEDLPLALEVLADMLIRPTFPPHEVEKLRAQLLMGLRESEQDTGVQANRAARALLFPAEHPYSRPVGGSVATVQAIARDDLAAFHTGYGPDGAIIAVVGDVEPAAAVALLEERFGHWRAAPPAPAALPPVPPLDGPRRRDLPMAGKVQADLVWAVHGLRRADPDYDAAVVANLILGRLGLGGRLGENVRERQGMAYYCYSGLEADLGAGPWSAVAGVSPDNVERAVAAIRQEVAQFAADGPTAQELDDARAFLTGSMVLGLETNDGIAAALVAIERHGLGLDYIARYPQMIGAVSAEQIVAVARRYLAGDGYVLAVAGPQVKGPAE